MVDDSEQPDLGPRPGTLASLAGTLTHDLNNLLGVVLNYATLLERQMTEPLALADLAQIRTAAERAAQLTNQLHGLARQLATDRSGFDLNACLGEVIAKSQGSLPDDLFMSVSLSGGPLHVATRPRDVEQALTALLTSAYQAISGHGSIAVTTRLVDGASAWHPAQVAVVSVSDNGAGPRAPVPTGIVDRLFTATERLATADGVSTTVSVAFPLAP